MAIQKIKKEQIRSVSASSIDGTVAVNKGGTGVTALSDIVASDTKLTVTDGTGTVIGGNVTIAVNPGNIPIADLSGNVDLTSKVANVLPLANGGTGSNDGNITSAGTLTFTSANNSSIELVPQGNGDVGLPSTYLTSGTQDENSVMPKSYIDSLVQGIRWNEPVRVATAENLPNTGAYTHTNGQWNAGTQAPLVIDGVTLQANDRVLVKDSSVTAAKSKIVLTCSSVPADSSNLQFNFQDVYYQINFSNAADSTSFSGAGTAGDRKIWNIDRDDGSPESTSTIITSLKTAMDTESNINASIAGAVLTLEQFTEGAHTNANAQTADAGSAFAAASGIVLGATTGSGIYSVADAGSGSSSWRLDRVAVSDVNDIESRAVFVMEGTANADAGFVQTLEDIFDQNKSDQVYSQFTGLGQIIAGNGISKSGNTISADLGAGLDIDGSARIRIASAAAGVGLTGGADSALAINYVKDQFVADGALNKPALIQADFVAMPNAGDNLKFSVDPNGDSSGAEPFRIDFASGTDVKSQLEIDLQSDAAAADGIAFSVDPDGSGGAESFRIDCLSGSDVKAQLEISILSLPNNGDEILFTVKADGSSSENFKIEFSNGTGAADAAFSGSGPATALIQTGHADANTDAKVATKIEDLLNSTTFGGSAAWGTPIKDGNTVILQATATNSNFDFSNINAPLARVDILRSNYSAGVPTTFSGGENGTTKLAILPIGNTAADDAAKQRTAIQALLNIGDLGGSGNFAAATVSGTIVALVATATNSNFNFSNINKFGSNFSIARADYSAAAPTTFSGGENGTVKLAKIPIGTANSQDLVTTAVQALLNIADLGGGANWDAASKSGNAVTLEAANSGGTGFDFSAVSETTSSARIVLTAVNRLAKSAFQASQQFASDSDVKVYLNGLLQENGVGRDYIISGTQDIYFNDLMDVTVGQEDRVIIAYFKSN